MPALISYDPSGATFSPISLEQFYKLLAEIKDNSQVTKLEVDGLIGSCTVQGIVDLTWKYDGANGLHVAIAGKHGRAHFAPNSAVFDELNKQFINAL
jgi:hypothetical protein